MALNGFQYALTRLYREYLSAIGPRCVAEFVEAQRGNGNGDQPPSPEQIAAGVDVLGSAASAEYFLQVIAREEATCTPC